MMQQYFTCPICGSQVAYGARFCGNCGTELDWSSLETPAEQYENQEASSQQQPEQTTPQSQQQPSATIGREDKSLKKRKRLAYMLLTILGVVILVVVGVIGILGGFNFTGAPDNGQTAVTPQNGAAPDETKTPAPLPVINSFSITPLEMLEGDTAELSWNVSGATSISIDQGIGDIAASGKKTVMPSQSTTYKLTATNAAGSISKTARIIVNPRGMPVINSFAVSPGEISAGETVTLSWNVSGANKINILGIGDVPASDTQEVSPTSTTTYTLRATNSNGISEATATVTMTTSGVPAVVSFTADPEAIYEGQSVTLEWHVTGADSVSIDNSIGTVSPLGSEVVSPTKTTTYTLTATNDAGSKISTVIVEVATSGLPLITNFSQNPVNIIIGKYSTLQWTVINATSISIDQSIGAVEASGSRLVSPTSSTTYTLTASSDNGTATRSVSVFVIVKPIINSFTADDPSITQGESTMLRWDITGAGSVSISPDIEAITGFTPSCEVSPTVTTTYTLRATNAAGETTATVTVNVTNP